MDYIYFYWWMMSCWMSIIVYMKVFFTLLWFMSSYWLAYATSASQLFWRDRVTSTLQWGWDNLIFTLDNILGFLIGLLYFISVVVVIYWWFLILVSGWDDDKLKKWKNLVIYALIWLIVIFLASNIVLWVVDVMSSSEITW